MLIVIVLYCNSVVVLKMAIISTLCGSITQDNTHLWHTIQIPHGSVVVRCTLLTKQGNILTKTLLLLLLLPLYLIIVDGIYSQLPFNIYWTKFQMNKRAKMQ